MCHSALFLLCKNADVLKKKKPLDYKQSLVIRWWSFWFVDFRLQITGRRSITCKGYTKWRQKQTDMDGDTETTAEKAAVGYLKAAIPPNTAKSHERR